MKERTYPPGSNTVFLLYPSCLIHEGKYLFFVISFTSDRCFRCILLIALLLFPSCAKAQALGIIVTFYNPGPSVPRHNCATRPLQSNLGSVMQPILEASVSRLFVGNGAVEQMVEKTIAILGLKWVPSLSYYDWTDDRLISSPGMVQTCSRCLKMQIGKLSLRTIPIAKALHNINVSMDMLD